jgi:hypothetical protein
MSWIRAFVVLLALVTPAVGETRIAAGQSWQMDFTAPKLDGKGEVHLILKARVDWPTLGGGSNPVMILLVNGKPPGAASLKNKPLQFTMRDGSDTSWLWGNAWRVVFCPDFSDKIRTEPISVGIPDTDPFSFEWDITPLVQPGKNTISIRHDKLLEQPVELVLEGVQVKRVGRGEGRGPRHGHESHSVNSRRKLGKYIAGAFQPARPGLVHFSPQGSLLVHGVEVQSRFSQPNGGWFTTSAAGAVALQPGQSVSHTFSTGELQVVRTVTLLPTRVHVVDHLKNTSANTVGTILEHRFQASGAVFLGGRKAFSAEQSVEEPAHPTVFWDAPGKTMGLVAEDDIFRVHVRSFQKGGWAGLSDPRMAIPGSSERLVEWSLYDLGDGDYWDFINTVRQDWKVNQTLGWPLVFESGASSYATQYAVGPARARWVTLQATFPDGKLAEGTAIEQALPWCNGVARQVQELKGGKVMMYLHGQICTEQNAANLYGDSQALKLGGGQVLSPYSYPVLVFLPTLTNAYGNALYASVLRALGLTHVGGVYWDEMSYATERYVQAQPWDNCSAEISPESHAIVGLISSVPLLKQPWDGKMVRELQGKGMDLVGNGPAFTRSTMQLMVPRIAETSSYRNLVDLHLSTPWGLANHELDRTVASNMRMTHRILDFGCLMTPFHMEKERYPWVDALYPFTPVELRSGVLMGKERIVTNRSGVFGWVDGSPFEVLVFDLKGQRVRALQAGPEVDLKLKPGELAVLVRQGGKP